MDMRKYVRDQGELASIYAEDGAYFSAARVLFDTSRVVQAHAERVMSVNPPTVPATIATPQRGILKARKDRR